MGQPIKELTIRGFKSIRELESFELNSLNVMIGGNGAGKSNFVKFFLFLRFLIERQLHQAVAQSGGAEFLLYLGSKNTDHIDVDLAFGVNGYQFCLVPSVTNSLILKEERIRYKGDPGRTHDVNRLIASGKLESQLVFQIERDTKNKKICEYIYNAISQWRVYHFHDTSGTAKMKKPGVLHDNALFREDASNLAAFLYWFKDKHREEYQYLRKTIQLAIPFFDDFRLEPTELPTGEQQIVLTWRQKGSDYPFWPSQLSDGSLRFICLATALLQPKPPSTIIIDEPELGLHPHAITLLASLLRKASKRMQVIVSTQSVPLVNQFDSEDLIIVDRENGASTFKRLDRDQLSLWLEDYSLGDLWEKNVLGGGPLA